MLERSMRRTPHVPVGHPLAHPFEPHAPWALRHILGILRACNALYSQEGRAAMASSGRSAVLEMAQAEVHVCLGQSALAVAAAHHEEDLDGGGVGGVSVYSARSFLRGLRDGCYQVMQVIAARCPKGFFFVDAHARGAEFAQGLLLSLESMEHRHLRMFLRCAAGSIVRSCPREGREAWLSPLLPALVSHVYARLQNEWGRIANAATLGGAAPREVPFEVQGTAGETAEVVYERLLRDTTREFASLLASMAAPDASGNTITAPGGSRMPKPGSAAAATVSLEQAYGRKGLGEGGGGDFMGEPRSVLEWLLVQHPAAGAAVIQASATILSWPDRDAAQRASPVCRAAIAIATRDDRLVELTATHLLACAIANTRIEVHNTIHSEALSMIREVVLRLSGRTASVQGTFASTTGASPAAFAELERQLREGGSEKKTRDVIRGIIASGNAIPIAAADAPGGSSNAKSVIQVGDRSAKVAAQRSAALTASLAEGRV